MAAFNGVPYAKGTQVDIKRGGLTVRGTIIVVGIDATSKQPNGVYMVDTQYGQVEQVAHYEIEEVK